MDSFFAESFGTRNLNLSNSSFVKFWASDKIIANRLLVSFILPSSPNSPKTKKSLSLDLLSWRAIRSEIARSKWLPSFLSSDGDRLTVIFRGGNLNSLELRADLILSRDSSMELPASPTILNPGRPFVKVVSISTICASSPSKNADFNSLMGYSFI